MPAERRHRGHNPKPPPRAELLHIIMLPDFERAASWPLRRIGGRRTLAVTARRSEVCGVRFDVAEVSLVPAPLDRERHLPPLLEADDAEEHMCAYLDRGELLEVHGAEGMTARWLERSRGPLSTSPERAGRSKGLTSAGSTRSGHRLTPKASTPPNRDGGWPLPLPWIPRARRTASVEGNTGRLLHLPSGTPSGDPVPSSPPPRRGWPRGASGPQTSPTRDRSADDSPRPSPHRRARAPPTPRTSPPLR